MGIAARASGKTLVSSIVSALEVTELPSAKTFY